MSNLLRQYVWIVDLIGVLLCAFFAAKVTNEYVAKLLEVERRPLSISQSAASPISESDSAPLSHYKIIVERNIFDASENEVPLIVEDSEEEELIPSGVAVKTNLKIDVLSVLVVGKGVDGRSTAVIQGVGRKAEAGTYAVGDRDGFAPNTQITKIQPNRVDFLHSGRLEYALVDDEEGVNIFAPPAELENSGVPDVAATEVKKPGEDGKLVKSLGENKYVVDQTEVDNALNNLERLYTEIRAIPNFSGGKVSGMKIISVKKGSIFDKLGLKRGDVLERINGVELDVKQGLQIFSQLKNEKSFNLDLKRHGQTQTFEYEIR